MTEVVMTIFQRQEILKGFISLSQQFANDYSFSFINLKNTGLLKQ